MGHGWRTNFSLLQLGAMALGLALGGWLLVSTLGERWWQSQPIVAAFYAHDMLDRNVDEDGMFHSPAFDRLKGKSLGEVMVQMRKISFSCEPRRPARDYFSCYYGYKTASGCCRFRLEIHYDQSGRVTSAHGDKTGLCPR